MSINSQQLRELIIRPVLQDLNLWSESAENLLMGTAAQETLLGYYVKQQLKTGVGTGRGRGLYSMEPETHDDRWANWLKYKALLANKIRAYCPNPNADAMIYNLAYATAMARIKYAPVAEQLPAPDDIAGLARYWKKYYNTENGLGTEQQFIENYKRYAI